MRRRVPTYLAAQRQRRKQRARRRLALIVTSIVGVLLLVVGVARLLESDSDDAFSARVADETPAEHEDAASEESVDAETPAAEPAPVAADSPAEVPEEDFEESEISRGATQEPVVEAELWGPPDPFVRYVGSIKPGDAFGTALDTVGVPPDISQQIIRTLRGTLDFRRIRPHDAFSALVSREGELLEFTYERGSAEVYSIEVVDGKWIPLKKQKEYERRLALVQGEVSSTLFEAVVAAGESPELIMNFVDIFAWEIDFSIMTRKGDRFLVLVEKLFDRGSFFGYGRIYHARYVNQGQEHAATYFEAPDGFSGYFDREGRNLRKAFLRAPLNFRYISSGFTSSRFHPVLGKKRSHRAIDYAAPTGTPIWSVADGVITDIGWMGGAGRAIRIRHANGYTTSYSHLSRFAKGMRKGTKVRQQQIIGYVGATGLATGPHLHYVLKVNGTPVNPARVKLPAGDPVPRKYLTRFQEERGQWENEVVRRLEGTQPQVLPAAATAD